MEITAIQVDSLRTLDIDGNKTTMIVTITRPTMYYNVTMWGFVMET
jgi:hypothetical protein